MFSELNTLHRIVVLMLFQVAAEPRQLCAGRIAGVEAAVHAVRSVFDHDDSDAILLVDATNATFNSLNRSVALQKYLANVSTISLSSY